MKIFVFNKLTFLLTFPLLCTSFFGFNLFPQEPEDKIENFSDYEKRIIGGEIAAKDEFPSIVLVLIGDIQSCGGTIIQPGWVLTAAHCLDAGLHPSAIISIAGAHTLSDDGEKKDRQCRNAKKYFKHPKYRVNSYSNDIALLQLQTPFDFNTHVNSSNLPPKNGEIRNPKKSVAAGWGRYSNELESPSNVLKKVELSFVGNKRCRRMYAPSVKIVHSMICAGGEGADACSGDSGGPLFCNLWNSKERFLCGIVSVGTKVCGKEHPGIYTRVTSYVDWIENTIKINT